MENQHPIMHQNVIVMRHGDRIDNSNPLWTSTAARPWDPPL
ncbi:phosphoglycerate mutase family protein, partial [Trifolium medium]|nr:phosphoglycerate mutase family protein [Trifolium medium]